MQLSVRLSAKGKEHRKCTSSSALQGRHSPWHGPWYEAPQPSMARGSGVADSSPRPQCPCAAQSSGWVCSVQRTLGALLLTSPARNTCTYKHTHLLCTLQSSSSYLDDVSTTMLERTEVSLTRASQCHNISEECMGLRMHGLKKLHVTEPSCLGVCILSAGQAQAPHTRTSSMCVYCSLRYAASASTME